ncbi:MAG: pantoate--beta-alanine ligase [Deltaproteobacteria bacterium GWA2_45_12]|nr:MAG: pantoate--beta-alanine ligase [Deltaproteobacteria bacterium GWA2_45_12]
MIIIRSPQQMQKMALGFRAKGKTIAVVPTMGYLHEGHVTLLRKARRKADIVILTLFVNPTQFGPKEDLSRYPRDEKGDLKKAKSCGTDIVFLPQPQDMYPVGYQTYVEVIQSTQSLCGVSRPHHFKGVTTVVTKLFAITQPHYAFFGLKDYQQYAVICRMAKDLNLPVQIIGVPTVREKSGLAMSSRNVYLNVEEKKAALCLSRGLKKIRRGAACRAPARKSAASSAPTLNHLVFMLKKEIKREPLAKIDYIAAVDAKTIQPLKEYQRGNTLFAVAVFFGKTRLIDNIVV